MKRTSIAAACMAAGVASVAVGVAIAFGVGLGVIAAGVGLIGVSILLGWDA